MRHFSYFGEYRDGQGAPSSSAPLQESIAARNTIMAGRDYGNNAQFQGSSSPHPQVHNGGGGRRYDPVGDLFADPIDRRLADAGATRYVDASRHGLLAESPIRMGSQPHLSHATPDRRGTFHNDKSSSSAFGDGGKAAPRAPPMATPSVIDAAWGPADGAHLEGFATVAEAAEAASLSRRYPASLVDQYLAVTSGGNPAPHRPAGALSPQRAPPTAMGRAILAASGAAAMDSHAAVSAERSQAIGHEPSARWHGIPVNHKMAPFDGQPLGALSPKLMPPTTKTFAQPSEANNAQMLLGSREERRARDLRAREAENAHFQQQLEKRRLRQTVETFAARQVAFEANQLEARRVEEGEAVMALLDASDSTAASVASLPHGAAGTSMAHREPAFVGGSGPRAAAADDSQKGVFSTAASPIRSGGGITGSAGSTIVLNTDPNSTALFSVARQRVVPNASAAAAAGSSRPFTQQTAASASHHATAPSASPAPMDQRSQHQSVRVSPTRESAAAAVPSVRGTTIATHHHDTSRARSSRARSPAPISGVAVSVPPNYRPHSTTGGNHYEPQRRSRSRGGEERASSRGRSNGKESISRDDNSFQGSGVRYTVTSPPTPPRRDNRNGRRSASSSPKRRSSPEALMGLAALDAIAAADAKERRRNPSPPQHSTAYRQEALAALRPPPSVAANGVTRGTSPVPTAPSPSTAGRSHAMAVVDAYRRSAETADGNGGALLPPQMPTPTPMPMRFPSHSHDSAIGFDGVGGAHRHHLRPRGFGVGGVAAANGQQQQQQQQPNDAVNEATDTYVVGTVGFGASKRNADAATSSSQQPPPPGADAIGRDPLAAPSPQHQSALAAHPYAAPSLPTGEYGLRTAADGLSFADDFGRGGPAVEGQQRPPQRPMMPLSAAATGTDHTPSLLAAMAGGGAPATAVDRPIDQHRQQHELGTYNKTIRDAIEAAARAATVSTTIRGKREELLEGEGLEAEGEGNAAMGIFGGVSRAVEDSHDRYQRLIAGDRGAALEMQPRDAHKWAVDYASPHRNANASAEGSGAGGLVQSPVFSPFPDRTLPGAVVAQAAYNTQHSPTAHRINIGDQCAAADLRRAALLVATDVLSAEIRALVALRDGGLTSTVPVTSPLALLSRPELEAAGLLRCAAGAAAAPNNGQVALRGEGVLSSSSAAAGPITVAVDSIDTTLTTPDRQHSFLHRAIGPSPLERPTITPSIASPPNSRQNAFLAQFDENTRSILVGPPESINKNGRWAGPSSIDEFSGDATRYLGDTLEGVRAGAAFTDAVRSKIVASAVAEFTARHTPLTTRLPLSTALQGAIGGLVRREMLRASVTYGRHAEEPAFFYAQKWGGGRSQQQQHQSDGATNTSSAARMVVEAGPSGAFPTVALSGAVPDAQRAFERRAAIMRQLDAPPAAGAAPGAVWVPGRSFARHTAVEAGTAAAIQSSSASSLGGDGGKNAPFVFSQPIIAASAADSSADAAAMAFARRVIDPREDLRTAHNLPLAHPAAVALAADLAMNGATVVISEPTVSYAAEGGDRAQTKSAGSTPAALVIIASVNRSIDGSVAPPVWTLSLGNEHVPATTEARLARIGGDGSSRRDETSTPPSNATPLAPSATVLSVEHLVSLGVATTSQILRTAEQSIFALELRLPGAVRAGQQYTVWFRPTPSSTVRECRTFWVP